MVDGLSGYGAGANNPYYKKNQAADAENGKSKTTNNNDADLTGNALAQGTAADNFADLNALLLDAKFAEGEHPQGVPHKLMSMFTLIIQTIFTQLQQLFGTFPQPPNPGPFPPTPAPPVFDYKEVNFDGEGDHKEWVRNTINEFLGDGYQPSGPMVDGERTTWEEAIKTGKRTPADLVRALVNHPQYKEQDKDLKETLASVYEVLTNDKTASKADIDRWVDELVNKTGQDRSLAELIEAIYKHRSAEGVRDLAPPEVQIGTAQQAAILGGQQVTYESVENLTEDEKTFAALFKDYTSAEQAAAGMNFIEQNGSAWRAQNGVVFKNGQPLKAGDRVFTVLPGEGLVVWTVVKAEFLPD